MVVVVVIAAGILMKKEPQVKEPQVCGIENCHGLDITCGPNVPEVCDERYQFGDFCREYFAGCGIINGICSPAEQESGNTAFGKCKSCVMECEKITDQYSDKSFLCEEKCRAMMKLRSETQNEPAIINSFEECIAAGNPAMESYPRQCMANGKTFVEEI